jgi:hypothetical protein
LKWFKNNKEKFLDYDFTGVPDSKYISLLNDLKDFKTFNKITELISFK